MYSSLSNTKGTAHASYDTLIMNQTDNTMSINLGINEFLDLDSNIVCGSITLQPYTSQILIGTNVVCATGIADNKRDNQITVYPNPSANEIRITGAGNPVLSTYEIMDTLVNSF